MKVIEKLDDMTTFEGVTTRTQYERNDCMLGGGIFVISIILGFVLGNMSVGSNSSKDEITVNGKTYVRKD